MVLLPHFFFLYPLPSFFEIRFEHLLTGAHPNFVSVLTLMTLTYEMGLILNYMLYIVFLEKLIVIQLLVPYIFIRAYHW